MSDSILSLEFPAVCGRGVVAEFDGGDLTSDAGMLLLRQAEGRVGVLKGMASAVEDRRDASRVRHTIAELFRERVFAIASGYEDANDLDDLREDPGLKVACEKRVTAREVLGSQPTISRLENAVSARDLYRMGMAKARSVIDQLPRKTRTVMVDVDAFDDPCHGQQQFEMFNGYYDKHCYLPLLFHITGPDRVQRLVAEILRPGNASYRVGLFSVLRRIVCLLRERFPLVSIILRADSGFGHADVIAFCEERGLGYVLGLAGNRRLHALSTAVQMDCAIKHSLMEDDTPEYGDFEYKAGTWPHRRRVVVKCEVTLGKLNPRYVVTNLAGRPKAIYRLYCARGDRENRIKEMKLDLAAGRTSCHRFLANQCRLLLHGAACVLMTALQEAAQGTRWADAQVSTIRARLLKVAARVVETCRRIWFHLPTSYVDKEAWLQIHRRLCLST